MTILFCNCSYANIIPEATKQKVLAEIAKYNEKVIAVADLCKLAADNDPVLDEIISGEATQIIACYPRTITSLYQRNQKELGDAKVFNMRTLQAEEIIDTLKKEKTLDTNKNPINVEKDGDWIPWFPVIDYQRCVNCKQCLSFCLFGVYDIDPKGKVRVAKPQNCKTNCPACARICPEVAIIFPKYPESPINGDEILDENRAKENIKINVEKILGDDPYTALRERRKKAKRLLKEKKETMITKLSKRILTEIDIRLLWKIAYNLTWKGFLAVKAFEKRQKTGDRFPAFLILSINNACNLKCQGCWVTTTSSAKLNREQLDAIVNESKKKGSYFFGILGGEPLLHPELFDFIAKHKDCYFQLFTNGTLITDKVAKKMRSLGNITPLISIEGLEEVSDERRGGKEVFQKTLEGLKHCRNNRLFIGVASSICKSNIHELATEHFVNTAIKNGVHYLWYYIYRAVGPNPTYELALSKEDILFLRRFIVDIRTKAPIVVVDAYWDHLGRAICPGAIGISHHISASGDIEFCPPIQFAKDNIADDTLENIFNNSDFLQKFRSFVSKTTRGCILLDHPDLLTQFLHENQAKDTTGRKTGFKELCSMQKLPCHDIPEEEIPEKSWMYRFAKKYSFFGFGAYG